MYADGRDAMAFLPIVLGWTRAVTLVTARRDSRRRTAIDSSGTEVTIEETRLRPLLGHDRWQAIELVDDRTLECDAFFVHPTVRGQSSIVLRLGCGLTDAGLIEVGADHQTTVDGLFAAGDAASRVQQIVVVAAAGASAAYVAVLQSSPEGDRFLYARSTDHPPVLQINADSANHWFDLLVREFHRGTLAPQRTLDREHTCTRWGLDTVFVRGTCTPGVRPTAPSQATQAEFAGWEPKGTVILIASDQAFTLDSMLLSVEWWSQRGRRPPGRTGRWAAMQLWPRRADP